MPSRHEIVTFHDPLPPGESPWVAGAGARLAGARRRARRFDRSRRPSGNPGERELYARTKLAAAAANAEGEHSMQYNARKQQVVHEIYRRAFLATGLQED